MCVSKCVRVCLIEKEREREIEREEKVCIYRERIYIYREYIYI